MVAVWYCNERCIGVANYFDSGAYLSAILTWTDTGNLTMRSVVCQ